VEPPIPKEVIIEWDMLGMITMLKYFDHGITYENNIPKLVPNNFLIKSISFEIHMITIES
jgi:hypothetical protein